MTGPFYSNGLITNTLIGAFDVTSFINAFKTVLVNNNWTVISTFTGFGGTPGYILQSVPTNGPSNSFRVKFFYNHRTSGFYPLIDFFAQDSVGGNEQFTGSISISSDLGDKTLRVIAGIHQYFIFIDYTISPNNNYNRLQDYNNVMAGVPYTKNQTQQEVFWGCGGNGGSTFRNSLKTLHGFFNNESCWLAGGLGPGSSFPDVYGNTKNFSPTLLSQRSVDMREPVPHFDGYNPAIEPILIMGRVPNKYWGYYLWDAFVACGRYSSKVTCFADQRYWESFTLTTDPEEVGCLFLVTTNLSGLSQGGFSY